MGSNCESTDNDSFNIAGPKDMTDINWGSEEHRRCAAACILKGTSLHAHENNNGLAPPWWEKFNLELFKELKGHDQFMFGAIYRYAAGDQPRPKSAPAYIIAFRGTMLKHSKPLLDLYHDIKVVINDLRKCSHFDRVLTEIRGLMVETTSAAAVWLVGHSLGAAFALDVGRHMMIQENLNFHTFLFNPPQVSMGPAINWLHLPQEAKKDLYAFSYFVKCALGKTLMKSHRNRMEEIFEKLLPWEPQLYVHEGDIICQGFIDYFEMRQQVDERFHRVAESAMMMSYRDMASSVFRENKQQPHLLPTARLWKVTKESHNEDPHGLKQWWMSNVALGWSSSGLDPELGKLYRWRPVQ
ncbi:GDSL esterase/lipase At4g10955-like [Oryza glaberrima]|uniref:GDSL esterase/lipase At4g10955-like n=1 Tax=Oryza glaberrima TaxID=4538 RepID=UPI00023DC329|nr:GDSL esterase/lipase At4g10955-like [Oryza glaberrima]XP_052169034.1 GDSL esterase/lipase At4g10955-like [Oryza glaberrima]XP_052169035.1 GDSL esterase/lipase At4g10955-like [Oryza glaberrima]XP_052169036.1 GDSL esterase/lipase At4g10955-like [Oryza glaberrima]XP_052169037.1 GDSL esterase/lipase At4g10955-like [Oryza glaberrima]XP_052169038.1 GDSL esterase/lipase At4g10955-like [Oryza glaberrima]